jgi:CheY-like chemotaxis protein
MADRECYAGPVRAGLSILIVDDDDALRGALAQHLEHQGCAVAEAAHGLEALARVAERCPDLIVLDLHMPVMCGARFLARFRGEAAPARYVPVVLMTGDAHPMPLVPADAVLAKPFPLEELRAAVDRLVPGAG